MSISETFNLRDLFMWWMAVDSINKINRARSKEKNREIEKNFNKIIVYHDHKMTSHMIQWYMHFHSFFISCYISVISFLCALFYILLHYDISISITLFLSFFSSSFSWPLQPNGPACKHFVVYTFMWTGHF